jgi:D-apionolactonase
MEKLNAGNIELSYVDGFLRYLKLGETEVLRMIYFAIRDANWGNYQPTFYDEVIEKRDNSFEIKYKANYFENGVEFFNWNVSIIGLDTDEIHFEIEGEAKQEFMTNRAGFCILHPIEKIADEKVEIVHSNGDKAAYLFPKFIAPHQPFIDITAMKWEIDKNEFNLKFIGDIFETEDQRNWGDASYKTYCTPLSIPFPKQMNAGDRVHQKVIFSARLAENEIKESRRDFPLSNKFEIGICESISTMPLNKKGTEALKSLPIGHYRIEVYTSRGGWKDKLHDQINIAKTLGLALEMVLILDDGYAKQLDVLIEIILSNTISIKYLLLLSEGSIVTDQEVIDHIPELKKLLPNTKIGVGTNYNFTELNRHRFDAKEADFISLAFDPQEHANDDLTIIENAETVRYLVESAKEIYNKPIHISPIMFKRRFNPYATDPSAQNIPLHNQIDDRHSTSFLAMWTKLLFENLALSGVASATLYQSHGPLGIIDEDGERYPVYEIFKNELWV